MHKKNYEQITRTLFIIYAFFSTNSRTRYEINQTNRECLIIMSDFMISLRTQVKCEMLQVILNNSVIHNDETPQDELASLYTKLIARL